MEEKLMEKIVDIGAGLLILGIYALAIFIGCKIIIYVAKKIIWFKMKANESTIDYYFQKKEKYIDNSPRM